MARENCNILDTGDKFPALEIEAVGGGKIILPDDFGKGWSVMLFYRGHW
ncbi:MAG: hypothetical protein HZB62_04435 [Nitrospirae bacterium]|nr:hypothetical protein [Nitrospirota bacterium]